MANSYVDYSVDMFNNSNCVFKFIFVYVQYFVIISRMFVFFSQIGSGDKVRATTTVVVPKEGPITATSIIEAIPPHADPSAPPQEQEVHRLVCKTTECITY